MEIIYAHNGRVVSTYIEGSKVNNNLSGSLLPNLGDSIALKVKLFAGVENGPTENRLYKVVGRVFNQYDDINKNNKPDCCIIHMELIETLPDGPMA